MRISVSKARNSFSKLLHLVENGETVIITRRNIAVVRLRKIRIKEKTVADDLLADFLDGIKLEL
jgi:antitoxin (DNA-binding transcriptional repressor) of toxin-antitoxin stability system